MTDPTAHATTLSGYRAAALAALAFTDLNLTDQAQVRQRADQIRVEQARLTAAIPQLIPEPTNRADLIARLAPSTADEVAVLGHEHAKISALLAAGQTLDQIISTASAPRAHAVLDAAETLPDVLSATDPTAAARAVSDAAISRLADLGDAGAVETLRAERAAAMNNAWSSALTEMLQTGDVSIENRTAIHQLDQPGYQAGFADAPALDHRAIQRTLTSAEQL